MAKNKRWTKEEEQYLFSVIQHNADNLDYAFGHAAEHLGRTKRACCARWYSYMRDRQEYTCCFFTIGKKTLINGKISTDNNPTVDTKVSLFNKIINFFKGNK